MSIVSDIDVIGVDFPAPAVVQVMVPDIPEATEIVVTPPVVESVELPQVQVRLVVTLDAHDDTTYWYGGTRGTAWKVNRFSATTFARRSASVVTNPGYLTLADAWIGRTALVYV